MTLLVADTLHIPPLSCRDLVADTLHIPPLSCRDLAYEKLKETLSVIPEEVVDKVGLENLGVEQSSVEVSGS